MFSETRDLPSNAFEIEICVFFTLSRIPASGYMIMLITPGTTTDKGFSIYIYTMCFVNQLNYVQQRSSILSSRRRLFGTSAVARCF